MLFPFEVTSDPLSQNMLRRAVTWLVAPYCGWRGEKQIVRMQRRGWRHRRTHG